MLEILFHFESWAHSYETFSMLNSAEHEILYAHNYEHIKKVSIFWAQIGIDRKLFSLLINVKMHL